MPAQSRTVTCEPPEVPPDVGDDPGAVDHGDQGGTVLTPHQAHLAASQQIIFNLYNNCHPICSSQTKYFIIIKPFIIAPCRLDTCFGQGTTFTEMGGELFLELNIGFC